MARSRLRSGVIAVASAGLVASSLWAMPVSANPTPAPEESPTAAESPSSEPTPGPAPSPDLSPAPTPAPSPSLTPSPGDSTSSPEPSVEPTNSPTDTASPSPSETEGAVDDYIVVVRNGAYIDSIKDKAEQLGGQADKELRGAVDGFTATLTEKDVEELEADPNVKYVERDEFVQVDGAVSGFVDCNASAMGGRDDGGIGPINLGFDVDWFGTSYSSIYINNNGGFVFNDGGGAFTAYNGIDLQTAPRPYVLPLFTDIDTRFTTGVVEFGPLDNTDPTAGFCINWIDVGEYGSSDEDYSFQVILTNLGGGEIDLEFNYDRVSVPTNASNNTFEVGYTAGDQTNYRVLADSTESAATVASRLVGQKFPASCTVPGRYIYEIRSSGTPTPGPTPTPEPTTPNPTPSPTQTPATWGLDRIDQATLPLNNTYITPTVATASENYGQGVVVYVVDTGVRYTHQEFGNRARKNEAIKGIDEVDNDTDPNDCNGHGTHVAGTVGGYTYGVAKQVEIVGVRVLGCTGGGWTSDVVAGLNAIPAFHATHYGSSYRAVVNMSLGGGKSVSMNAAVASLTSQNIPVVVAAGNDNEDASDYSPASEPTAITVGATTSSDARSYFSNYGPLVDVFAPGSSITAAWYTSNSAIYTISGTSMASPHVAGAVALYLGLNSASASSPTNAQVQEAIVGYAETGRINLGSPPTSTANKLLNVTNYATPFSYTTALLTRSTSLAQPSSAPVASTRIPRQLIEARCTGRDSGGNPAPPAAPPSSGGGGGSGGGGSSSDDKPSGGGGGLADDEIQVTEPAKTTNQVDRPGAFQIVDSSGSPLALRQAGLTPQGFTIAGSNWEIEGSGALKAGQTQVAPGEIITIRGEGLQRLTTTGVYILSTPTWVGSGVVSYQNEFITSFMVPALPPGQHTLQINIVRQGQLPASIAIGFELSADSRGIGTPGISAPKASQDAADFVTFKGTSTNVSKATRNKLTRLAQKFAGTEAQATIVAYTNAKGTAASKRRAETRGQKMSELLQSEGFTGSIQIVTEPGSTKAQSRGVLVYVQPSGSSAASTNEDAVRSLIVRLKKGRSITVDGQVRGADNVTGPIGDSLAVGPYLGLRMYRVDFAEPVSVAVAERVSKELARDPGIDFAEPDSIVSTQVSITS